MLSDQVHKNVWGSRFVEELTAPEDWTEEAGLDTLPVHWFDEVVHVDEYGAEYLPLRVIDEAFQKIAKTYRATWHGTVIYDDIVDEPKKPSGKPGYWTQLAGHGVAHSGELQGGSLHTASESTHPRSKASIQTPPFRHSFRSS
jgi:hypothetical protein